MAINGHQVCQQEQPPHGVDLPPKRETSKRSSRQLKSLGRDVVIISIVD
jgi:hypothetical protein